MLQIISGVQGGVEFPLRPDEGDEPEDAWNLVKKDHPDVTWIVPLQCGTYLSHLPILGPLEECAAPFGLV